jgi:hypothetical protein
MDELLPTARSRWTGGLGDGMAMGQVLLAAVLRREGDEPTGGKEKQAGI